MKPQLILCAPALMFLAACDPQPSEQEQLQRYEESLKQYSCEQLAVQKRINEKTADAFASAQDKDKTNGAGDVFYNAMTLGTDTWEDGRSMSESVNETRRVRLYRQRSQYVLAEQQRRCRS